MNNEEIKNDLEILEILKKRLRYSADESTSRFETFYEISMTRSELNENDFDKVKEWLENERKRTE